MRLSWSLLAAAPFLTRGAQPNPPTFGSGVSIFSASDAVEDIQQVIDAAYANNGGTPNHGQFSSNRYAFLFRPGSYDVDVDVGYYTSVYGLGMSPEDTKFTGAKGVNSVEGDTGDQSDGALSTFWRSAENFRNEATYEWWSGSSGTLWAVSQAAPLRRVHVTSDLLLSQDVEGDYSEGYSSGGFMGNSLVDGQLQTGSQQQFLVRNCDAEGGSFQGNWNMVYVGTVNAPDAHCGNYDGQQPNVVVGATPTAFAEKPFIVVDEDGLFYLMVPGVAAAGRVGPDWVEEETKENKHKREMLSADLKVPFSSVYVADNTTDTAETINDALDSGLHVVLSPGIFELDAPLRLGTEGQVLLGLGFATLVSAKGNRAVEVADVPGCRVAGILLQAGPAPTDALLVVGSDEGHYAGDPSKPVVLSDVFARVGGPDEHPVQAATMVVVNAGNVLGDNLWLWRADHTVSGLVYNGTNPCTSGMVVKGDDVSMFGLAVEHTLGDLTVWHGDRGQTYFYQSELPYDVSPDTWPSSFAGYRVEDGVTSHTGVGVGVYHYFRDYPVTVDSGIVAPKSNASSDGVTFVSPLGVYLSGNGVMNHVMNDDGDSTGPGSNQATWICE